MSRRATVRERLNLPPERPRRLRVTVWDRAAQEASDTHVWADESDPGTVCARCGIAWRVIRREPEPCRERRES